jgi:hypothetical protein
MTDTLGNLIPPTLFFSLLSSPSLLLSLILSYFYVSPLDDRTRRLLERMFVPDPQYRITLQKLRIHPAVWVDMRLLSSLLLPFARKLSHTVSDTFSPSPLSLSVSVSLLSSTYFSLFNLIFLRFNPFSISLSHSLSFFLSFSPLSLPPPPLSLFLLDIHKLRTSADEQRQFQ